MATTVTQWRTRRLASRAARIVNRRAKTSAAMAAYQASIGPQAAAFMASYDHAAKFAVEWRREMGEGRTAIQALLKQIQAWVPLLLRDIPGFDGSIYGDKRGVPDDVLEDGERLLSVIDEYRDGKGEALPYRQQALDMMGPVVKAAAKEWGEAEAADKEYQNVMGQMRSDADVLQRSLIALRRSLLAEAGSHDKDYQKLRVERAGYPDDDDDPAAPSPPSTKPAPASATPPSA